MIWILDTATVETFTCGSLTGVKKRTAGAWCLQKARGDSLALKPQIAKNSR